MNRRKGKEADDLVSLPSFKCAVKCGYTLVGEL